jgi:hypothetical protein
MRKSASRDILIRQPWLRVIGQWLGAEYAAVQEPVPERLAALVKKVEGPPPGVPNTDKPPLDAALSRRA